MEHGSGGGGGGCIPPCLVCCEDVNNIININRCVCA